MIVDTRNVRSVNHDLQGSTLVGALLRPDLIHWVHVGDSRLYLWHYHALTQVTQDQTLARVLAQEVEIPANRVPAHHSRNVLDQYIGCGHCEPETGSLPVRPEDRFLFCSDGPHRPLAAADVRAAFNRQKNPAKTAAALMAAAIRDGGAADDITLVVCARGGEDHRTDPGLNKAAHRTRAPFSDAHMLNRVIGDSPWNLSLTTRMRFSASSPRH